MSNIEETEVKVTETVAESEEPRAAARWIEDHEDDPGVSFAEEEDTTVEEAPKKKRPLLQVPVIISICLVVFSLLAFFAYQLFWIAEPEGVTWVWSSETDNVNWYYEFKDGKVFKAYVGSFEVTANYTKEKNDEVNKLMVSADVPYAQSLGCIFFSNELNYTVKGSRLFGSQEMTLVYPEDPEAQEFVLTQAKEREPALELPDDFTEDKELTGEWLNIYSTDDAKQTIIFNEDGSMSLSESYEFSNGNFTEIRRNCTYTVADNEINITWKAEEPVVHNSEYVIKDGLLYLDGAAYYRAGSQPSTPDQSIQQ